MLPKMLFALTVFALAANVSAKNEMTNGDLEYGDGGWYLWNNPDGPADATSKIGAPGIGFDGSQGAVVSISAKPKDWWGLQLQPPKFLADTVFYELSFKAKADKGGSINAVVQGGPPDYRQKTSASFTLTPEWKTYKMKFLPDQKGYGVNNVVFQLGYLTGNVYFDDVSVETVDESFDVNWYKNSATRIDSIRKQNLTAEGFTPGDTVQVSLKRHAFPFGTAIAFYGKMNDSLETWYRNTANKYFWYAVPENQFKWPEYEPKKGKVRREELKKYLDFVQAYNWGFRAHTLIWGIQKYDYDKHFGNQGSCKEIAQKIHDRIDRDVKEYKGRITEYDVWNEPIHETYLFDKCGWDLLDSSFVWAHRADPTAKLYVNDYNVVAMGETERYYELIKGMLDRKVPVMGIGVQCHFNGGKVVPALIKERLDRLAELGLPIKVTEFDMGSYDRGFVFSEEERANQYEMFLRSTFSHPAVKGILFWGFWDSRHWIPGNGGFIAADGTEKPAGKRVYDLWHKVWTTNETLVADEKGAVHFRGYPGLYELKTKKGSQSKKLGTLE
ncbi:MAG: endo-1,4-beta-xylanase [Fibrobacter sp.]|nr:endo-1,4-beta-xylanase [Fibrobacter sp.]